MKNTTKFVPIAAGALFFLFALNVSNAHFFDGIHAPCPFLDTVDLTGYHKFPNGSYLYEGSLIPFKLVGTYDFKTDELSKRIPAEPHDRGCICKLKPCVKLCCPLHESYNGSSCTSLNTTYTSLMNITTSEDNIVVVDLFKKFSIQFGRPCPFMYHLTPHLNEFDSFSLFENGTLKRWEDKRFFSKNEFCLSSYLDEFADAVLPLNCFEDLTSTTKSIVYACMMMFSVPFMLLTIIIYIAVPELRTLHGKSLCCYLIGLCVGYSILSAFLLIPMEHFSQAQCKTLGFTAYFSFMASFFWLSVISFDLFFNIRAPRGRFNEKKRFIFYSLYAWGLALFSLGVTYFAQQASFIPSHLKPAIGSEELCWLEVKVGWSALIYFYGPIVIIIGFNITMFVLTALQIHGVQKEMSRMMERNDSQKNLSTEKDRFGIFLRLFMVMGVTWSMEIISYMIGNKTSWDKLFYVTDICNGIQGFLIFTLFVLKKKVKQYILNRFNFCNENLNCHRGASLAIEPGHTDGRSQCRNANSINTHNTTLHGVAHNFTGERRPESRTQYIPLKYHSTSHPERQSQYSNKTTSSSINLPMNGIGADKPLMDKVVKIQN